MPEQTIGVEVVEAESTHSAAVGIGRVDDTVAVGVGVDRRSGRQHK